MLNINIRLNNELNFSFLNKLTLEFHRFHDIDLILKYNNENLELYKDDYLQEALDNLVGGFKKVIDNNLTFPDDLNFDKGIYYYNQLYMISLDKNTKYLKIDYPKSDPTENISWLLSTNNGYQTFLYSYKNEIYLEIAKAQEFEFDENDDIDINSFNTWLNNYSISYRFKINETDIKEFLNNIETKFKNIYPDCFFLKK